MLGVAAAGETRHARGTERPLHEGDGLRWEAGVQEAPPPPKTPCTYLTIRGQVLARAVYMGDAKQGPCPHSNRSRCQYQLRGAHGTIVLHGVVLQLQPPHRRCYTTCRARADTAVTREPGWQPMAITPDKKAQNSTVLLLPC
jgi:hypothetical protein